MLKALGQEIKCCIRFELKYQIKRKTVYLITGTRSIYQLNMKLIGCFCDSYREQIQTDKHQKPFVYKISFHLTFGTKNWNNSETSYIIVYQALIEHHYFFLNRKEKKIGQKM